MTKSTKERYSVIPRTLIFVHNGEEILFKKGVPGRSPWPGKLNGVGGHVEQGETILQAALRETREETGLVALEQLIMRGVVTIDSEEAASPGVVLFVFTAYSETKAVHASEEGELGWFDWHTLPEEHLVEDLPALLSQLERGTGESLPQFFAHYGHSPNGNRIVTFM